MATPAPRKDQAPDAQSTRTTPGDPTIAPPDEPTPRGDDGGDHPKLSLEEAKKNLEKAEAAETGDE